MEKIEVEQLSHVPNSPVIRIPTRKYPGVLIQGDSLWMLYSTAKELYDLCKLSGQNEQTELAMEMLQVLSGYLSQYENTLRAHGIELPYNGSLTDKPTMQE